MKQVVRLTEEEINDMVMESLSVYYFNILNEAVNNQNLINENVNETAPLIAAAARFLAKPVGKMASRAIGKQFTKGAAKAAGTKLGKEFGKYIGKRELASARRNLMNHAGEAVTTGLTSKMFNLTGNKNKRDDYNDNGNMNRGSNRRRVNKENLRFK